MVRLDGEIDMATVSVLETALAGLSRDVVIDADGVSFMDSTGLKAILDARDRLASEGRTLSVHNRPTAVQRLFDAAGATL